MKSSFDHYTFVEGDERGASARKIISSKGCFAVRHTFPIHASTLNSPSNRCIDFSPNPNLSTGVHSRAS